MKRVLSFLMVFALLTAPCYASFGTFLDGASQGQAHDVNFTGPSSLTKAGGQITLPVVDPTLIATGAANGGATSMTTTDEAVPVTYAYVRKALTADSTYDDGTLADGKKGQLLTIHVTEGTGSFILTPTTATGWATITFDAVGEIATLLFIDSTVGWVIAGDTDATVALP